jgi:hypothetical protein
MSLKARNLLNLKALQQGSYDVAAMPDQQGTGNR